MFKKNRPGSGRWQIKSNPNPDTEKFTVKILKIKWTTPVKKKYLQIIFLIMKFSFLILFIGLYSVLADLSAVVDLSAVDLLRPGTISRLENKEEET